MHGCLYVLVVFLEVMFLIGNSGSVKKPLLTFGILLPRNSNDDFSLHRVLPVIRLAIQRMQQEQKLLPEWEISVWPCNVTACSSAYVPLCAIEMRHDVEVFFGPTCDYDLAPVVRYTSASWNIPVLSSGGRISVFDNKTEYPMLTRMNGYYQQFGDLLMLIQNQFKWNTIGMLFSGWTKIIPK